MAFKLTLTALIACFLLTGCSDEEQKLQQAEITKEVRTQKFMKTLVEGNEKEQAMVLAHYNKLDESFKEKTSFRQYYADLNLRYKKVLDEVRSSLQTFDNNLDPDLQISEMRTRLMDAENIPVWYQDFRTAYKEKLFEAAMAKDY